MAPSAAHPPPAPSPHVESELPASRRLCPCQTALSPFEQPGGDGRELMTPESIAELLRPHRAKRREALEERNRARERCRARLAELRGSRPRSSGSDSGEGVDRGSSFDDDDFDVGRMRHEVESLRSRLASLRHACGNAAVDVASRAVRNDERQSALEAERAKVDAVKDGLRRIRGSVVADDDGGGGLTGAVRSGAGEVRRLRFELALRVFDMHVVDVGEAGGQKPADESRGEKVTSGSGGRRGKSPSGVGKIGGLPLPHAGPALYGVIPPGVLASSLRLVASLTGSVARCLGVVLPHPILLRPIITTGKSHHCGGKSSGATKGAEDLNGDIAETVSNFPCWHHDEFEEADKSTWGEGEHGPSQRNHFTVNEGTLSHHHLQPRTSPSTSSPTSSLMSLMGSSSTSMSSLGRSARRAFARATGHPVHSTGRTSSRSGHMPSMDAQSVASRLRHASYAIVCESHSEGGTQYALNPPQWVDAGSFRSSDDSSSTKSSREVFDLQEEHFATGLQLLQNDVVALCFRAGVDADSLWPAEALLLNLHSLLLHCQQVMLSISPGRG